MGEKIFDQGDGVCTDSLDFNYIKYLSVIPAQAGIYLEPVPSGDNDLVPLVFMSAVTRL